MLANQLAWVSCCRCVLVLKFYLNRQNEDTFRGNVTDHDIKLNIVYIFVFRLVNVT